MIALGVLHHLDDDSARVLVDFAYKVLKPAGRLITVDPCYSPGQSPIARFLIQRDRGQNVRDEAGYETLVHSDFTSTEISIRHKAWVPYTHCIMCCTR